MAYGTGKEPKTPNIKTKYCTATELQSGPLSPWWMLITALSHLSVSHFLSVSLHLSPLSSSPVSALVLFSLPSSSALQLKSELLCMAWHERQSSAVLRDLILSTLLFLSLRICQSKAFTLLELDILLRRVFKVLFFFFLNGAKIK